MCAFQTTDAAPRALRAAAFPKIPESAFIEGLSAIAVGTGGL